MTFDVSAARADLPSVRSAAFLNAGTFGPMPGAAARAMHARVDATLEEGRLGYAGIATWIRLMDEARAAFARALDARSDDVALTHCTTDGCNTIVWGLPFEEGDEVLTTTHEHPGLTAPLEELARTRGVRIREVAPTEQAIEGALGPRTRLVACSHVLWTNGDVLPIASIAAAARRACGDRVFVLVDGAQSAGALEVDPRALGVDAYAVSGQKWLCGPSGTGALWVRPEGLARLGTPWPWYLSKRRGASGPSDWATARRLDASTVGMTSLSGAIAALGWHDAHWRRGAPAYARALANELRARLAAAPGVEVLAARSPSQLVSFRVTGASSESIVAKLEAARVFVRVIPDLDCVRASVGFWNDESDLDRLVEGLRS